MQGELWVPAMHLCLAYTVWWSCLNFHVCNFNGLVPALELGWGTKEATRSRLGPDCHLAPEGKGCTKFLQRLSSHSPQHSLHDPAWQLAGSRAAGASLVIGPLVSAAEQKNAQWTHGRVMEGQAWKGSPYLPM